MGKTLILLSSAAVIMSACTTDSNTLITVQTAQGDVTCNSYDPDIVLWDAATAHPASMSKATADTICRREGARQIIARSGG